MNKVYIANIAPLVNEEVYRYYYDRVGEQRRKKADKLVSAENKARCIGVGAVLRFAVEDATDYSFDSLVFLTEENGKPYVEGNPFYFSISHSGDYAVCAISDRPVGVDVEKERELSESFKARFAESVTEWTKKESKGKLTGKGVSDDSDTSDYIFTHEKTDGYVVTVCSDKYHGEMLYYHLPMPTYFLERK